MVLEIILSVLKKSDNKINKSEFCLMLTALFLLHIPVGYTCKIIL